MNITIDYADPILATPANLSAALTSVKRGVVLDTQGPLGEFTVAWRDGALCITQERRRQIRTTGPLAADRIRTVMQQVLQNDSRWDAGLEWHELPPRWVVEIKVFAIFLGPILFPPAWFGIVHVWVPRLLYNTPRCRAYAAIHGYTLIGYRSHGPARSGAPACVMAEGYVPFDTVTATSPPLSELSHRLFEQGFFQPLMWILLIAIVFLLYYLLKRKPLLEREDMYPKEVLYRGQQPKIKRW